ncbi:MAG: hypothetical protein ACTSUS_04750 [Candidatus Freyarchaeota archaeon]
MAVQLKLAALAFRWPSAALDVLRAWRRGSLRKSFIVHAVFLLWDEETWRVMGAAR